jgi:hypothetical protein
MSSRKDEISKQVEDLNQELIRLRRLGRKKEVLKEKARLTKLMTALILELDGLDKDKDYNETKD